jgi:L-ribulose-5-phosphate 4-epimerase
MNWNKLTTLYDALQTLGKSDVVKDTHGNVSQRADGNEMYIKPSGVPYLQLTRQDLVRVYWYDGIAVTKIDNSANGLNPSVDWPHHQRIYEAFPQVGGICHVHSPFTVAFAMVGLGLTCASTEQADYFGGDIPCVKYGDMDSWGSEVVISGFFRGYLLRHHGAITLGRDAKHAVELALALEGLAQKNYYALQIENMNRWRPWIKFSSLPQVEIKKWHDRYENKYGQK